MEKDIFPRKFERIPKNAPVAKIINYYPIRRDLLGTSTFPGVKDPGLIPRFEEFVLDSSRRNFLAWSRNDVNLHRTHRGLLHHDASGSKGAGMPCFKRFRF